MKPTDDLIVLAMVGLGDRGLTDGDWYVADEVRSAFVRLGFNPRAQQVAAWLGRLSREDSPMVERRKAYFDELQYRVTRFGLTQIHNHFPGLRAR